MNSLTFNTKYFFVTCLLFLIEVAIALFVHDDFIRPFLGDVLVVMLMYCFVKSFLSAAVKPVALAVLIFSFGIEFLQYIRIIEKLGWQDNTLARTVIGTSFSWEDLLMYVVGILVVLFVEHLQKKTA